MHDVFISAYFFGRETQIYSRENFSIFARENESHPWKNPKIASKVGVKVIFCPWNFWQITRVKTEFHSREKYRKLHPWKRKNAREKYGQKFVSISVEMPI